MKLLYVHDRFGSLAGAEANVIITASELKNRGHQVGILHGPRTGKGEPAWESVFASHFELTENAKDSLALALAEFQPDAIYVHKTSDLTLLQALIGSQLPLVRMVHDHDIYCMRTYKYNYFTRKICTKPAGLHCIFPCGAFLVRNHGPGLPVKISKLSDKLQEIDLNKQFNRMVVVTTYMRDELINNGFDPAKIRIHGPVPRPGEAGLRSNFSDRNLIIYAGQIIRGKGVDMLLHSLAKVQEKFECIILGDGSHKAYCEKLTKKLKLQDRVKFAGFVSQDELKNYYRETSVVALSSLWPEPIATIGLEVMRYALPVVAFDAGGIKDWLINGHNGFLVPWMDTTAYAKALETLLRNKQLARTMGANGFELVSKRYDFEQYISDLEYLFQSVIEEKQQSFAGPARQNPRTPAGSLLVSGQ